MRLLEELRPQTPSSAYWFWLKMGRVIYCVICRTRYAPPSRKAKSGAKVRIFLGNKTSDPPQKHGQKRHTKQNTLPITKKSTPAKAGNRPYLQEIDRERGRGMGECAFFRIFAIPSPP